MFSHILIEIKSASKLPNQTESNLIIKVTKPNQTYRNHQMDSKTAGRSAAKEASDPPPPYTCSAVENAAAGNAASGAARSDTRDAAYLTELKYPREHR